MVSDKQGEKMFIVYVGRIQLSVLDKKKIIQKIEGPTSQMTNTHDYNYSFI